MEPPAPHVTCKAAPPCSQLLACSPRPFPLNISPPLLIRPPTNPCTPITPAQTSQLSKLRQHFHKDIRRQLYGDQDDHDFFDIIKKQLKEIEKRLEDGRAALQVGGVWWVGGGLGGGMLR